MIGFIVFIIFVVFGYLIDRPKKNPYIENHKQKWKNENDYMDYLEWLNKNPDMPFPELKINHEENISKELNKTINRLK